MYFIICVGNPCDGFEYIGLFGCAEEANEHADLFYNQFDWWVIELRNKNED